MRWQTTANVAWSLIGILILTGVAGYAMRSVAGALAPFVVAFLFVFALQSPVSVLERRGVPRAWSVLVCFAIGFVAISVAVVFIVPPVGKQLLAFANAVPELLSRAETWIESARQQLNDIVVPSWLTNATTAIVDSLSSIFATIGNAVAKGIVGAGSGIATVFFDLFLGVVIAFWTLKDLPKIRHELRVLAGEKYEGDLENLISTLGRMVGGYIKGQTIACLVTGTITGVGLAILGVPYALVVGILAFVLNYVPYVGPFITGVIAGALGLFQAPLVGLGAVAVVAVGQNLTDTLVTPRVMSEQVDLHPTLVIFSLLVGGSLMGFWGMIFAIPVAAVAKALFVYYWERRTSRTLATEDGALFRTPTCEDDDVEPCEEPGEPVE